MAILPPELWLLCWALVSRRQLRRLLLVCKLFRSLCLPLLFSHRTTDIATIVQDVSRVNWIERTHQLHRLVLRLDRLAQPPYAQLVRSWNVRLAPALPVHPAPPGEDPIARIQRIYHDGPWNIQDFSFIKHVGIFNTLRDRAYDRFVESLGVYRNLITLEIEGVLIDEGVRAALRALENLEEFRLNICEVDPPVGTLLRLKHFTISELPGGVHARSRRRGSERPADYQVRLVDPAYLVELHLHSTALTIPMFNGFNGHSFPVLRHVKLWPEFDRAALPSFLETAPAIKSLVLPVGLAGGGETDVDVELLPGHLLPQLAKLTAHERIVVEFATGRPVSDVTVSHGWETPLESTRIREVLVQLSHGSLTLIRCLALPHTQPITETLAAVTAILPALSELTLDVIGGHRPLGVRDRDRGNYLPSSFVIPDLGYVEEVRLPELDDERAFEGMPMDELSDPEDDKDNDEAVTFSQSVYQKLLQEIVDGVVDLPPNLQVLRLRRPMRQHYCPVREYDILAPGDLRKLQERYSSLQTVALGSPQICRDHACAKLWTLWQR